jgi:uncharacterized integral membrane protein
MAYQYKRRRPSILRNFWVYRRLVGVAVLLGLMLWFIWANNAPVTVSFPFGLGAASSSLGIVVLLSAMVGSIATILLMTVIYAVRKIRSSQGEGGEISSTSPELGEDRPPADYASKTTEGFSNAPWTN